MKRILFPLLLTLFLIAAPVAAKTLNKIAVVVNNEIISTYQLDKAVGTALARNPDKNQLSAVQFDQLKVYVLEQLINNKLLEQRIRKLGLTVSDSEMKVAIEDVQRKNKLTRETLEQALATQGLTMSSYREQIKKEILRYKLLGREVNYKVLVTSGEVRDYFREHIDEYKVKPKVRVNHIRYKIPANTSEAQLTELYKQATASRELLLEGKEFDKVLAAQDDIASGGDMGELVATDMAKPLQSALADLQIGAVSGKPCLCSACNPGSQIPTGYSSPVKHDLRLVFVNQIVDYFCIAVCLISLE